jgi:CRP-like cAMP-binding protein
MKVDENMLQNYGLRPAELEKTIKAYVPERIKSKGFFVEHGKISNKIGFITKGLMRSFIYDRDGNDITTAFYPTGSLVISFESFNDRVPAKEYIVAMEDTEILVITHERQLELYQSVPLWPQICKDMASKESSDQQARALEFQTMNAKERYLSFCQQYPEVLQKAPLRHIATFLGIDNATLSRIRRKA